MKAALLNCRALAAFPRGESAAAIMAAALAAADPAAAVRKALRVAGDRLVVQGRAYSLPAAGKVWLVGAGKAGEPMTRAAVEILGDVLAGGLVIVKDGHAGANRVGPVEVVEAAHPVPDARGVHAARRMAALLQATGPDDLVLCLLSGGGSALLAAPAGGLSLSGLQALTSALLASGAAIHEINALRKHLELLKGGQLARLAAPARLVCLALSDVVGDAPDVIASGPAAPDPSTFADAWAVLEKYALLDRAPQAVLARLQAGMQGALPETPKPGEALFERVQMEIVGSSALAAQAALEQARAEGWNALLLTTFLEGEARSVGQALAAVARQVAATSEPLPRPACLIAAGETTVTLRGQGLGGRNQELALGAVPGLDGLQDVALAALATDGGDGPTDAAGAVVTGQTLAQARRLGLDPAAHLARNDAYNFFAPLGGLLVTGPTRTNVNDLAFIFAPQVG